MCVWGGMVSVCVGRFSLKMSAVGRFQTLAVPLTVGKAGKTGAFPLLKLLAEGEVGGGMGSQGD